MKVMISVTSEAEARHAVAGGAEIIDIKNPAEGSLGAQPPGIIRAIQNRTPGNLKVSAAIGDMPQLPGTAALAALGAAVCNVDFIKIGLFGPRNESEAVAMLQDVKHAVQDYRVAIIAALYADYERAGTIHPMHLPEIAAAAHIHGCLLDTAIKDGRRLFEFIAPGELQHLITRSREMSLLFGMAGGLMEQDLPLVHDLNPDIVGFRSAVCLNRQRQGDLDPALVKKIKNLLS